MKARTKNQKRVVKVNMKVKDIGVRIQNWAKEHVLKHQAVRNKWGTCNCLKCGHTWKGSKEAWHDDIMDTKCPGCKRTMDIISTNKRTAKGGDYFSVVTVADEYQVVTTYKIMAEFKAKQDPKYWFNKCFRIFIREDGKREVFGQVSGGMGYYNHQYQGEFCLRNPRVIDQKYAGEGKLYPKWRLQDYLIRVGFDAYSYKESDYTVVACAHTLLSNPMAETFVKQGYISLFKMTMNMRNDSNIMNDYWPTFKICMRHNFQIPDASSYVDMLQALDFFGKDILNPYYICPRDFQKAHDYWIGKKDKSLLAERRQADEARKVELAREQKAERIKYENRMKKFSGLKIVLENLEIRPFLKIWDVEKAADEMHHCMFKTVRYWQNPDNLLLGTYLKGRLIETTQYSLGQKRVHHSYGKYNKISGAHDTIIKLLKENERKISACFEKKKRKKKVAA